MGFGKIPFSVSARKCVPEKSRLLFSLGNAFVLPEFFLFFPEKRAENFSDVERAFYSVLESFFIRVLGILRNVLVVKKKSVRAENVEPHVVHEVLLPAMSG